MSRSDDKTNNAMDEEAGGGVKKFGFSLTANKKGGKKRGTTTASSSSTTTAAAALAFDDPDDDDLQNEDDINPDIPKKPLVIPLQQDKRKSLQEQARSRRQNELNRVQRQQQQQQLDAVRSNDDPKNINDNDSSNIIVKNEQQNDNDGSTTSNINSSNNDMSMSEEDRVAIQALQREASAAQGTSGDDDNRNSSNKRVIASSINTFQHNNRDDDQKQFENDIEQLPPDISVESQVYKAVPISEFGAAMLRGMGWSGGNDNDRNGKNKKNNDPTTMPRPSRLGLGATPKMNASGDAPDTHARRRPRRQDQVQREEKLRRQQEDMERDRQKQFAMDKQRVLQIGSIVFVVVTDNAETRKRQRRAAIKKLTGVPGLNMILIKYEGEATTTKVKKGNIELVERSDLEKKPFQEVDEKIEKMEDNDNELLVKREDYDRRNRDRHHRDEGRYERNDRNKNSDDRRRDKNNEYDERDRDRESDRHKRMRDDDKRRDNEKRHKKSSRDISSFSRKKESNHHNSNPSAITTSWLIPNIRVRVISSKYGGTVYKEKGVVVDVTRKGVATLKMGNGQVINVAERHLETALPKAGGNSIILSGDQRHSKGRLLERDSKKNRGVVQVFEDMSVITTSLDEMAEWCGPLDDDLEN
jgi:G patch domain/KOW motif-containing protein